MYPAIIKKSVDAKDSEALQLRISDPQLSEIEKNWSRFGRAEIIRLTSTNKEQCTEIFFIYDEIIRAHSSSVELVQWASYSKAQLMIDSREKLVRDLGDRDTAFAIMQEIYENSDDFDLKYEAYFSMGLIYLKGGAHVKSLKGAAKIFEDLSKSKDNLSEDLKTKVETAIQFTNVQIEEQKQKNAFIYNYGKPGPVTYKVGSGNNPQVGGMNSTWTNKPKYSKQSNKMEIGTNLSFEGLPFFPHSSAPTNTLFQSSECLSAPTPFFSQSLPLGKTQQQNSYGVNNSSSEDMIEDPLEVIATTCTDIQRDNNNRRPK